MQGSPGALLTKNSIEISNNLHCIVLIHYYILLLELFHHCIIFLVMAVLVGLTDGLNYYRPNVFEFNTMNINLAVG